MILFLDGKDQNRVHFVWSEKSSISKGEVRNTGRRRSEAAPVPETPHQEPREETQRLPVRTISKARGQVKRKQTAELVRALRKTGRAELTRSVTNRSHRCGRPGPDGPSPGRGCAGRGTARRKGRGHALQVPCAALTSAVRAEAKTTGCGSWLRCSC